MDVTFGALDAFAFIVFAVLLTAAVIIIVSLGQLPGRLARKWGHPQAAAVEVAGWIGIATGGLIWPLAFIWAFMTPSNSSLTKATEDRQERPPTKVDFPAQPEAKEPNPSQGRRP